MLLLRESVCPLLAAVLFPCALAIAQPPVEQREHLPLEIVVIEPGRPVARVPRLEGDAGPVVRARRWVGRKVEFRVGEEKAASAAELSALLRVVREDESKLIEDPDQPGTRTPLPVLIKPRDDARWIDIVRVYDAVFDAGFNDLGLQGAAPVAVWFIGKGVGEPVRERGELVAPHCEFTEPDDAPPPWRPVVDVHQTGRVVYRGATVFDPREDAEDVESIDALFAKLRDETRKKGRTSRVGPDNRERMESIVMLYADVWATWRDVKRVMRSASDKKIGFWKFEFATGEYDFEKRLAERKK